MADNNANNYSTVGNAANQAMGYVKSAVGGALNQQEMKESGDSQYYTAKGEADEHKKQQEREKKINEAKNDPNVQVLQGFAQNAGGTMKKVAGSVLKDDEMKQSGQQSQAEGQARFNDNADKVKQMAEQKKSQEQDQSQSAS
ncbi:hypothetical protein IWW50_003320 [Coemansia erecta]|nr:hypothetical protein IWW50_003320 [Coemansia erecta]